MPHNFKDLTGVRFEQHRLTVVEKAGVSPEGHTLWRCRKDNGREVVRLGWYLTRYKPKGRVYPPRKPRKPQPKPAPEKTAWNSMVARCTNPRAQAWKDYGGRGIRVCDRWLASYDAFLADVGPRPASGYSLERDDVEGHYDPGNVRWATSTEQNRNTRSNRRITYQGETLTLAGWAERLGVPAGRLRNRLRGGLPLEEVFRPGRKPMVKGSRGKQQYPNCGYSRLPEYRVWRAMRSRCLRPNNPAWKDYGGRGITVCKHWLETFEAFLADMGPRPTPQHSLERLRVNEGYEPGNCVWSTRLAQARNTRRSRLLTYQGLTLCVSEWAERLGVKAETIRSRLRMGWSDERALSF